MDPDKNKDAQEQAEEKNEPLQDEQEQEAQDKIDSNQVQHLNAVIYWAILNNQQNLVELAFKKGWNPRLDQEGNRKGVTWLHVVALAGHVNLLGKIPGWRKDIKAGAIKKITPLHLAAKQGNFDMVKELLKSLESGNSNEQESPSTRRQRVLQAIIQETEEEKTLISLAAARTGRQGQGELERFLWNKLYQIGEKDEKFFELPHSLDAEIVMGFAAWRHTTGERVYFDKFMGLAHRGKNCTHTHHSPLGLTVCSQFPEALWRLLSSGSYSGENHIREGENMMAHWDRLSVTKDPVRDLIEELLKNPPPVRPPLKDDRRPPHFEFERPKNDSQKGTVLSLSVTNKREIIFKLKRASMVDIIYGDGPDEIMRNDGYSNFQAFRSRLASLGSSSKGQKPECEGPTVEEKPGDVPTTSEREKKKKSEKGEASEPMSRERQSKFRWIHIPVNNLRYVEELMIRISMEKNMNHGHHRQLADFVQKSWSELPAGGRNHYMKPHFQSYINDQSTSKGSDTTKPKTSLPTEYSKVFALYMPYIFWGEEPNENDSKDGNERKSNVKTDQPGLENGPLQRISSGMKKSDVGDTKQRPASTVQGDQEIKEPGGGLHHLSAPISETGSSTVLAKETNEKIEQEPQIVSKTDNDTEYEILINDMHILTKKPVHKSITLDQYYYVSLQDTCTRDHDQVLGRYFKRLKEKNAKLVDEKQQEAKRGELPRKREKVAESSLQTHDHRQTTNGRDSPPLETMAAVKSTQILMVNQLWLWILDSDTIITSTTEESDEITNTFLQRVLFNLQARNGNTISTIEDIAEYIIATATSLFNAQDIEVDHSDDGKRSPLDIFRETIQYVRDEETKLFREFRISLRSAKQDKSSSKDNSIPKSYSEISVPQHTDPQCTKKSQAWWSQLTPENPYEDILVETELLDEVKDILDELNILKTLAQDQKVVDDLWKSASKIQAYRHLTPLETKQDIESMIEDAKSVQSAINTLLDLKQKEASILEAQAMRRQSDAVMVFTMVTIIFLPASFLTSMFTLNVADFPHQDGNLNYQGAWIFPIIFGVSVPVSIIFMTIAFNANKIKSIWRAWTERRNRKFQGKKSEKKATKGTVRRRTMGPGNDGNV